MGRPEGESYWRFWRKDRLLLNMEYAYVEVRGSMFPKRPGKAREARRILDGLMAKKRLTKKAKPGVKWIVGKGKTGFILYQAGGRFI